MRFLWLDINSSYSHSSLAFPALEAQLSQAQRKKIQWEIISGTINSDTGNLVADIFFLKPDYIFSTLWLFNSEFTLSLLKRIKSLLPDVKIILGGPEFLGSNYDFLLTNKEITAVFRGEAEETFPLFVQSVIDSSPDYSLPGFCLTDHNQNYTDNGEAITNDFPSLIPPENSRFFRFDKPFVQIETSRGCFNTCSFCVSGSKCSKVQYLDAGTVNKRLEYLASKGIKDVRILDRTFNANERHAISLLDVFSGFAGKMTFHLEIHPALIRDNLKRTLESLPAGLLHVEAGIQSLNDTVLSLAGRAGSSEASLEGLRFLISLGLFEVHADLIAGLPSYTYKSLIEDYITLARCSPAEIQTELLKVLPGTLFKSDALKLNLKYSPVPPYEVLQSDSVKPGEMLKAARLSKISDIWYNDKRWTSCFRKLITENDKFLLLFIDFTDSVNLSSAAPQRAGSILFDFCNKYFPELSVQVSHAWISAGLPLNSKVAGNVKKWEKGFTGKNCPFSDLTHNNSYYYLDINENTAWYSFLNKRKNYPPESIIIN